MSRNYSEGLTKSMIFQLPSEGEITGLSPSQDLAKVGFIIRSRNSLTRRSKNIQQ
jgi:hypothetical protein